MKKQFYKSFITLGVTFGIAAATHAQTAWQFKLFKWPSLALARRWEASNPTGACGALSDFLNEVRPQSGKKLTEAQAQQLTAAANDIRGVIGG
jgi:hypothetical protein